MYDPDRYKDKTARSRPLQTRGKERVRVILVAALQLFKEHGIDRVTTNDIVKRAGIPIGSLYRYYPNKDAIVAALTELYVADLSDIFASVGRHPMLKYLSWDEVLLLLVDGWVQYARLNGSFALLYALKGNPYFFAQNKGNWQHLVDNFGKVLRKRSPTIAPKQIALCFQFCLMAAEMGINYQQYSVVGPSPHYEAVGVIAAHMLRVCGSASSGDDEILA